MEKQKVVGIIQSNYIPWLGYFDFINSCDLFILHDDIQYTKADWRNRNKIMTPNGVKWLSVPVLYKESQKTIIQNTEINYAIDWISEHKKWITLSYRKSPYFDEIARPFFSIIQEKYQSISDLNKPIIDWIMQYLDIKTEVQRSDIFHVKGVKTERVLALLKATRAGIYISGPNAKDYLEEELFKQNHIGLRYKGYSYKSYPQTSTEFTAGLSILDLLFNCGKTSKEYIQSSAPDEIVY